MHHEIPSPYFAAQSLDPNSANNENFKSKLWKMDSKEIAIFTFKSFIYNTSGLAKCRPIIRREEAATRQMSLEWQWNLLDDSLGRFESDSLSMNVSKKRSSSRCYYLQNRIEKSFSKDMRDYYFFFRFSNTTLHYT